jgi:hypothetical protein
MDHLELVCNGRVVRSFVVGKPITAMAISAAAHRAQGQRLVRGARPASDLAGRAWSSIPMCTRPPAPSRHHPTRNQRSPIARYFAAWIDQVAEATTAYPDWNSAAEKRGVLDRLQQAKAVFIELE